LRPAGSYATPRELADEVERWLADEPVRAYREPVVRRLGRWGRRHRTAVRDAGVAAGGALRDAAGAGRRGGALASYEEFARDTGQDEQSREGVAGAYQRVGNILRRLGKFQEAEAAYRSCQERFARLAADYPAMPRHRRGLAGAHHNRGSALSETGRAEEAEREYRAALEVLQRLADDDPGEVGDQGMRARSHNMLGMLLRDKGRPREAEEEYRAALALERPLADEHPAVAQYRRDLANIHNNLGILLKEDKGRLKEAEGEYRAGLALAQRLVAADPAAADNRHDLAGLHGNLGILLKDTGRPDEAEKEYSAALSIMQRLADDYPAVPRYRERLGNTHMNLDALYHDYKLSKEKEEEQKRSAVAEFQRLSHEHPDVPRYQQRLAQSLNNLGTLFQAEAEQEFRRASALLGELLKEFPAGSDYHNLLANALEALAELAQARKEFAEARKLLEDALPHNHEALQARPRDPYFRACFRSTLQTLAEVHLAQGEHAEASAAAGQLAEAAVDLAKDRYKAACVLAGCVPLAAKDNKLPEARRQELARGYAGRAVAALRQAVADGHRDAAQLRKDPALDPLRQRDDFQKLLAEVEAAAKPEQKKGP
jgi:tetratricopeptide (TPR) repeat protein